MIFSLSIWTLCMGYQLNYTTWRIMKPNHNLNWELNIDLISNFPCVSAQNKETRPSFCLREINRLHIKVESKTDVRNYAKVRTPTQNNSTNTDCVVDLACFKPELHLELLLADRLSSVTSFMIKIEILQEHVYLLGIYFVKNGKMKEWET